MNMETLLDKWYEKGQRFTQKIQTASDIIREKYPEFVFVGKPPKQLLAIAGDIVKKYEWENCVERTVVSKSSDSQASL